MAGLPRAYGERSVGVACVFWGLGLPRERREHTTPLDTWFNMFGPPPRLRGRLIEARHHHAIPGTTPRARGRRRLLPTRPQRTE
jgi:hypothetical protein